jgi:hypothetical protein
MALTQGEAQVNITFVTMLFNSITDAATAAMALKVNDFTINGAIAGLMLFKCLLINIKVDAVNDARLLHTKLTKAVELMHILGHNITQFNIAHRGLLNQLAQCGQSFPNSKTSVKEAHLDRPCQIHSSTTGQ